MATPEQKNKQGLEAKAADGSPASQAVHQGGVVRAMRQKQPDTLGISGPVLHLAAAYFPNLKKDIKQADMDVTPPEFIKKSLVSALMLSLTIILLLAVFFKFYGISFLWLIPAAPLLYIIMFFYAMMLPRVKAIQRARKIDQELVFAGRHLLIEIKAGIPLFDSMVGVSREYGEVSKEFNKIVEKTTLGVPASLAMREVADSNPSAYFNRVILQIVNSLSSGSDLGTSLESVLDQISKEQVVQLKEYGQKLNPLVMFFMIFGIIMPSLGVAFLIILLSFVGG
ncbi:MAG TPA: type II secretion system F family protein, partial [Candidatus Micrarchaeota archaeon]|nr:type II secretion system F family protein [Candidatus Micrarchaeota archaeon]